MGNVAAIMSKATGESAGYEQVPVKEFARSLGRLGGVASMFVEVFQALERYGYHGPDSDEAVVWARDQVRGKLTSLEDFFEAHALELA
jgi:hypothetical protein